jgi:hypothetical protein
MNRCAISSWICWAIWLWQVLPRAQVFAYRGSHGLHTALAAALNDALGASDAPAP